MLRMYRGGFTLVELVVVVVLIGIITTIGVARLIDRGNFDSVAYSNQVRALIAQGQRTAVAQNRPVFVRLNQQSVALCFDSTCSQRVRPLAGTNSGRTETLSACAGSTSWYCEGVPQDVQLSATSALPLVFFFDAQGRPFAGSDAVDSNSSSFTTLTLTFAAGGTAETLTIERETGYVH